MGLSENLATAGRAIRRNPITILVAAMVVIVLAIYSVTYQVRFDEVAVVTTLGQADPPVYDEQGNIVGGDVVVQPGLGFKWFWPISKVQHYRKQVYLLHDELDQLQTRDNFSIIVRTFMAWRIDRPYDFFRALKTVDKAQTELEPLMKMIPSVISEYQFDDLVNTDPNKLKLDEISERASELVQAQLDKQGWGIKVEQVGIRRLVLPEITTATVFERMRTSRERLAEVARTEGEAEAGRITSDAENDKNIILAFAQRRAQAIKDEGDREAASYFPDFAKNEDLAIFLFHIKALEKLLPHNTTFVLDADELGLTEEYQRRALDSRAASDQDGQQTWPPADDAASASVAGQ